MGFKGGAKTICVFLLNVVRLDSQIPMATRSHDIKTQIILKNSSNYVGVLNSSRQQCLRSMKENTAKEVLLLGKRKQFFIVSPHKTLNLTV